MNSDLSVDHRYQDELSALRVLFSPSIVDAVLPRVREIYEYTKDAWNKYTEMLRDRQVRYLLIAEAPPWSPEGTPQYTLDPRSRWTTFIQAVAGAFQLPPASYADSLETLAARGFLLLDSIPFAMDYSAKRGSKKYADLIRLTTASYLQSKLDGSALRWSRDLRIAFGVLRNARAIMAATPQLKVAGAQFALSEEMVGVSGAGYPDAGRLRTAFALDRGGHSDNSETRIPA